MVDVVFIDYSLGSFDRVEQSLRYLWQVIGLRLRITYNCNCCLGLFEKFEKFGCEEEEIAESGDLKQLEGNMTNQFWWQ